MRNPHRLKRPRHMRPGECDNLLVVRPNQGTGSARSNFGNRRPKFAHQPSRVASASDAGLRRIAKPANATALPVPPKTSSDSFRRVEMFVEPVNFTSQLTALPILGQSHVGKNLKCAREKAKLRTASHVARGDHKSNIHLHIPRNARAYLLSIGMERGITPQACLGACGWFWGRDVRYEKHVALKSRLRRYAPSSHVRDAAQHCKLTPIASGRVVLHICVSNEGDQ